MSFKLVSTLGWLDGEWNAIEILKISFYEIKNFSTSQNVSLKSYELNELNFIAYIIGSVIVKLWRSL